MTTQSIDAARKRFSRHLDATSGAQTEEEFRHSPYYVDRGAYGGWRWNESDIRADASLLATAYVAEHTSQEDTPNHVTPAKGQ